MATHSHSDGELHRPFREYVMAVSCPTCGMPAGLECVVQPGRSMQVHSRRDRKATAWQNRDIQATPWREDRTPGACYSTLPDCHN